MERRTIGAFAALILGLGFAIGPGVAGFFISESIQKFKKSANTVTVKGLVEKIVKSDRAEWSLTIKSSSNDPEKLLKKMEEDQDKAKAFLIEAGVKQSEISILPAVFTDRQTKEYVNKEAATRYILSGGIKVNSKNVDLVAKLPEQTVKLAKMGVALSEASKPIFILEKFNEMRPALVSEATKNARNMAEQFAKDSGVKVGNISYANQGVIRILPTDGGEEWNGSTRTVTKKLRVVSTFNFYLED